MQRSLVLAICVLVTGNVSAPAAIAQTLSLENLPHLPAQPATIAQAVETPASTFFVNPKYGINFTTGPGSGYGSSFGSIYGWLPFAQDGTSQLFFTEAKANVNSDNGNWGGNLAVGYRNFAAKTIFGGYVGYDIRGLEGWTAHQLGAGLEAMNPQWEARLNGYLPVGDRQETIDTSQSTTTSGNPATALAFRGNNLFLTSETVTTTTIKNMLSEESLAGLDLEAGTTLTRWKNGQLKGFLGSYLYGGDRTDTFVGIRGRLQAKISNFDLGLGVESDGEFGTNLIFSIGANFGGNPTASPESKENQLSTPLQRQANIATKRYIDSETSTTTVPGTEEVALNPATNQPLIFNHVNLTAASNGAGTEEDPHNLIASAIGSVPTDGNGIIYVEGTGSQPGFKIPAQVKVLASAPTQTLAVTTASGAAQDVVLPRSGTGLGNRPQLTSTVTFSDGGGELNGFAFNTGGSVLFQDVGGEVVIANNLIKDSISDAIAGNITNGATTTVRISKNQIDNPAIPAASVLLPSADGIDIEVTGNSTVNLFIDNNDITNAQNSGIELETNSDRLSPNSVLKSTITNNRITNSGGDGILFLHNSDVAQEMIVSGNTINGAGLNANGITKTTAPSPIPPGLGGMSTTIDIGSGGFGIGVITLANGNLALTIERNVISNTQDAKIGIAANPVFLYIPDTVTETNPMNNTLAANLIQVDFSGVSTINANILSNNLTGTGVGVKNLTAAGLANYNTGSFTAIAGSNGTVCTNLNNNIAENINGSGYQFVANNTVAQIVGFIATTPPIPAFGPPTTGSPNLILGTNTGNTGTFVTTEGMLIAGTCN
ncbi:MAG: right-handed parallel beta-helix repeat-containing protein [Limnothrix sp. RL_2_0]|nr:right-handed parallel beta-helix repeat-containing protein [Limnothrix sp. RL_2_0]